MHGCMWSILSLMQFVNINVLHEFYWLMSHYMMSIKYLIMLFQKYILSRNVCMNVLRFEELFRHNNVWICKLPFYFFTHNIHNKLSCDQVCQHCCQINVFMSFTCNMYLKITPIIVWNKYSLNFCIHYCFVASFCSIQHVCVIK
jgi:hypothetical protein